MGESYRDFDRMAHLPLSELRTENRVLPTAFLKFIIR